MRFLILLIFAVSLIGCVEERERDRGDSDTAGVDIDAACDTTAQVEALSPRIDKYNKDLEDGDYPHLCAHWRKGDDYTGGWCWWSAEPIDEDVCSLVPRCMSIPEDDIEQARADKCN